MAWHDACLVLTILLGVFGGCFLVAGFLSLNTVVGERSRKDGRMLMEKKLSGSTRDRWEAKMEINALLPEVWAKQRVTRWLVYSGVALIVSACFLGQWATSPQAPPPSHDRTTQQTKITLGR